MSALMGILLMTFCILMGPKLKANEEGRFGEGSSKEREIGKQKRRRTMSESSQSDSVSEPKEELAPGLSEKEKAKSDMEKWQQTVLTKDVSCERQVLRE